MKSAGIRRRKRGKCGDSGPCGSGAHWWRIHTNSRLVPEISWHANTSTVHLRLNAGLVGMRNVDWAMFTFLNHMVVDAGLGLIPASRSRRSGGNSP